MSSQQPGAASGSAADGSPAARSAGYRSSGSRSARTSRAKDTGQLKDTSQLKDTRRPKSTGQPGGSWAIRVLPPALLIVLAAAGLRGRLATPRWNSLHRGEGLIMSVVLLVVLVVLLVIVFRRFRAALGPNGDQDTTVPAAKLRSVLLYILGAALACDIGAIIYGLHLKLPPGNRRPIPALRQGAGKPPTSKPHIQKPSGGSLNVADILYALLVIVLIAAVIVSIMWARRLRPATALDEDELIAEDPESLRDAVESGWAALRTFDDAKAAIIACYLAMERSLTEHGTARSVADTPSELLERATRTGMLRGGAARRLTQLFYEARFSSHPMDQDQRAVAEQALSELAEALRQPAEAGA